jgi:hypothetical protein
MRDTFPFEERSFFRQAVEAVRCDEVDRLRMILARHGRSVWVGRGGEPGSMGIVAGGRRLIETCDDCQRQLADHARSQETLIEFYLGSLREVDRLQRELEQAAGDYWIARPTCTTR